MSRRIKPKKNASVRTLKRWADPMNREVIDKREVGGHNPDCTRGRNPNRFDRRKALIKSMGIDIHEQ